MVGARNAASHLQMKRWWSMVVVWRRNQFLGIPQRSCCCILESGRRPLTLVPHQSSTTNWFRKILFQVFASNACKRGLSINSITPALPVPNVGKDDLGRIIEAQVWVVRLNWGSFLKKNSVVWFDACISSVKLPVYGLVTAQELKCSLLIHPSTINSHLTVPSGW